MSRRPESSILSVPNGLEAEIVTSANVPNNQFPTNSIYHRWVRSNLPIGVAGAALECVTTDAGELWIPMEDEVIRQFMRSAGTWESEVGQAILGGMPKSGGVFLDIGAHVGYFSCLVARNCPTCTIHAFEPNPKTYGVLALNSWNASERIITWPFALQGGRGLVSLTEAVHNTGDTRGINARDGDVATIVGPAIALDELQPDLQAAVVKIDVQGAELDVIQGMMGVIGRSSVIRIIMEYSPNLLEERSISPVTVLKILRECGFNIALINGSKIFDARDSEILSFSNSAGPDGHVNIMLYKQ